MKVYYTLVCCKEHYRVHYRACDIIYRTLKNKKSDKKIKFYKLMTNASKTRVMTGKRK